MLINYYICPVCNSIEWIHITAGQLPVINGKVKYQLENTKDMYQCINCKYIINPNE